MLLGIDLGTSSVKAVLLDQGRAVASASRGYRVDRPRPRWAESSPDDWWQATIGAVRGVVSTRHDAVSAIGLSGQMHGVVMTDAHGDASRPAILWADQRSLPVGGLARPGRVQPPAIGQPVGGRHGGTGSAVAARP